METDLPERDSWDDNPKLQREAHQTHPPQDEPSLLDEMPSGVKPPRSLKELIERVSGRNLSGTFPQEDAGIAEILPFPFLGIVGQSEMKLALLLALINPVVGGVLLIGPRGTGKTTAVRSLVDLLPDVERSLCYYGCLPEDVETGGIDAICPNCAQKFAQGEPLSKPDRVRLIELPLNAKMEDVVGGIDERAAIHERMRIRRGILAQADRNLLYVDEVNLLSDDLINAILDAAAMGRYTVRRGPLSATYRSRFTLIGSMNPEEGNLRPQILDRFGLRVIVRGLSTSQDRLEAYRRAQAYLTNPRRTVQEFAYETSLLREEIQSARELIRQIIIPDDVAHYGLMVIKEMQIDSLRAEITLFEAARAYAAADARCEVSVRDIQTVAAMALRGRRSEFIHKFFSHQEEEDADIQTAIEKSFIQSEKSG